MYIGNLKQVEELYSLILRTLRDLGIKHRLKKSHFHKSNQDTRCITKDNRVFRRPLCNLKTQNVTLKSGADVEIPSFIVETCCYIKHRCDVEGIFRKGGSTVRLREIKAIVDSGKHLDPQHHVVDVSNALKLFFRELPEPLLPYAYHDLLLRCLLVNGKSVDGILLTSLLFPSIHLNTLAFLMEFFKDVADNEQTNKMSITNLALIITPSLMPVEEKMLINTRIEHHVQVIKILMENSEKIGFLPECITEKALTSGCVRPNNNEMDTNDSDGLKMKKKSKRRSGSLTRMINGLKKMVGKGSPEVSDHPTTPTPDFPSPCVKSIKKRKLHESSGAFSSKKKREILQSLPQSITLADAPCTPLANAIGDTHFTPMVHSHPNPGEKSDSPGRKHKHKRLFSPSLQRKKHNTLTASKSESRLKSRLSVSRKSGKKMKKTGNAASVDQRSPDTSCLSEKPHRTSLDWQWKTGPWRRKKCRSSSDTPLYAEDLEAKTTSSESMFCSDSTSCTSVFNAGIDLSGSESSSDTEFVKIPKSEYEEIKNRVSAIENRISHEFGCIASDPHSSDDIALIDETEDEMCGTKKVQNAYEKTLEESEKLGDHITTDQLAKRLSKELKIRHSLENKVIRSPSARKIGTIRRRSRENARTSLTKVTKNSPKHVKQQSSVKHNCAPHAGQDQVFYPRSNLRRGRPNTVYSGLPSPSPLRIPVLTTNAENAKMSDMSSRSSVILDKQSLGKTTVQATTSSNTTLCKENVNSPQKYLLLGSHSLENASSRCEVRRASSFHGTDLLHNTWDKVSCDMRKSVSQVELVFSQSSMRNPLLARDSSLKSTECWENAPQFFRKEEVQNVPVSGRESVAKIRSQNAGMVLARMRLFDKKQDPNRTPSRVPCLQIASERKPINKSVILTSSSGQSLRIQCIQDNFLEKLHSQGTSAERRRSIRMGSICNSAGKSVALKSSPKKIGSPRKKYQSQRSPKFVNIKQKLKPGKSPQKDITLQSGSECNLKKFNSLRAASSQCTLTSKANHSAPPSVLSCGKENISSTNNFEISSGKKIKNENSDKKSEILHQIHLPENLKETIYDVCTPRIEKLSKMSMSPLKVCNRIDIGVSQFESNRQNFYKTPRSTPYIKTPLLVKSPAEYTHTPYCRTPVSRAHLHRVATPLKALPNLNAITPVVPQQQKISLCSGKSRNMVKS